MPVIYRNKKIIPAPLVSISREIARTNDGTPIGQTFRLNMNGTIVAYMGSPTSSGTFWDVAGYPPNETIAADSRQYAIQTKQEALRDLFSQEGYVLEFQPWDGSAPIKCQPRIISMEFSEGPWFETCPFTISFEADRLDGFLLPSGEGNFDQFISSADENWSLEFNDQGENENQTQVFRLSHNVSAVGKRFYDPNVGIGPGSIRSEAWEQARIWVQSRLGLDTNRVLSSGTINLPSYFGGFNHGRSESVNKLDGSYSVVENWIISSGSALEDFTIDTKTNQSDGVAVVTIQGNIQGLETRDSNFFNLTQTKYAAAEAKLTAVENAVFARAQNYSSLSLNPVPLDKNIGRNPINGTISYSYTYDTRPGNCIAGAKSETIEISDDYAKDIFAAIPILGRTAGPILQDIGTISETSRSLSIECVMPIVSGCLFATWTGGRPNYTSIISSVRPVASQVFVSENTESWSPKTGRATRRITWVYQ